MFQAWLGGRNGPEKMKSRKISGKRFRVTDDNSGKLCIAVRIVIVCCGPTSGETAIRNLCIDYNDILLSQARVAAACNALHVVESRFCRWLLQSSDRAGSNTVLLTQEVLGTMLGVRRTSVSGVASKIQSLSLIHYSRGVIQILDRKTLEEMSCECYQTLLDQSATRGPKDFFAPNLPKSERRAYQEYRKSDGEKAMAAIDSEQAAFHLNRERLEVERLAREATKNEG